MRVSFSSPSAWLPFTLSPVCSRLNRQASLVLSLTSAMIPSKTSGVIFCPVASGLRRFREHEAKAENLDQFCAHRRIARVARQLVKNELPDEIRHAAGRAFFGQPFDVLNLPRTELRGDADESV